MAKGKPDQRGGHVPPLRGARTPAAPQTAVVTGGLAPQQTAKETPPMDMRNIRGGTPPRDTKNKGNCEYVTGGTGPYGKIIKGAPMPTVVAASGGAPRGNMSTGAGKTGADVEQNRMDAGRKYAKGGQVGKDHFIKGAIKHPGVERAAAKAAGESTHQYMEGHKDSPGKAGERARLGLELEGFHAKGGKVASEKAEERSESKAQRKAERQNPAAEANEAYAMGGKVNRHGADKSRVKVPANGGNGGLPGGNAAIPLAQPGGMPSTGVVASGRMVPSFAGQDTAGNGLDGKPQQNNLRATPVARRGKLPSFSRPRRAA